MTPKVYIIGAGSGTKDYMILKAYQLLTTYPDVVIYDRLISQDIIELIPANCEKIFAGKEPDLHHKTQDEINDAIIIHAKADKKVIRLKGGDPFIFGRGGEECQKLKAHNIDFEVIPGISAANLSASLLNIPLTYRGVADGVIYLSGHAYDEELPKLDYSSLAKGKNTIVLYMSVGNIPAISKELLNHGMDRATEACVISNAGSENQKSLYSNLENISVDIEKNNIKNPSIIVIGDVVKISRELN